MSRERRGAMGSPQASGEERGGVPNAAAAFGCLLGPRDK